MAHVKLLDGREFDVPDGDPALDYYRGEGATVTGQTVDVSGSVPVVFDGEQFVDASGEHVAPASDEPRVGYSVPQNADGSFGPATLGPDGATAEVDGQTVQLTPDGAQSGGEVDDEHNGDLGAPPTDAEH